MELRDSTLDLSDDELFKPRVGPVIAYAVCYIRSVHPRRALRMRIDGSEQAKIYLNEQQVFKTVASTGHGIAFGLRLNKGLNVLVLKSVNEGGSWMGSVRFTDDAGNPVEGIKVILRDEEA